MRKTSIFIAVCMIAAMALTLYAQRDIDAVMKEVGPANGAMGKNIQAGAMADVAKDAEKLQGLFKETGEFMKAQKQSKAVAWADEAAAAAGEVAKAAKAGDAAATGTARGALVKTCQTCHAVHRDTTGGGSKYKAGPGN